MKALFLVACAAGCTAVTDFSQFHIVGDGGARDLANDLTYLPASFGAPCDPGQVTPCVPGQSAPTRPLQCFTSLDGHPVAGSLCTRECSAVAGVTPCSDYPAATCAMVGAAAQPNYCVPTCDLPSVPCRSGLTCCNATVKVTSGSGACVPSCPN